MTVIEELSLCDCCALMVANGDDSGCRDYYAHTHGACDVPFHTVMDGEAVPSPRGFTCDGCGEEQDDYANEWPAGGARMTPWGRAKRPVVNVPESSSTPAPAGATFGPWADHNPRCTCNVCR